MEIISAAKVKSSLYCWVVLTIFIACALIFMVNFYNRAVKDIQKNYANRYQTTI